jgi:hypothetical protein
LCAVRHMRAVISSCQKESLRPGACGDGNVKAYPWRNLTLRYLLVTSMAVVLAGCVSITTPTATLEPSLTDQSILTDTPCAAPCWYGLELRKSTKADALATAHSLSFIDPKEFPEKPEYYMYWDGSKGVQTPGTFVHLRCSQPDQTCAGLLFVNDSLKEIWLFPNYALSLSQLVSHLGEPEYVSFYPNFTEGPFGTPSFGIGVVWKRRGIDVGFYGGVQGKPKDRRVDKNLQVRMIRYMLPESYALASTPQSGMDFPWAGFREP